MCRLGTGTIIPPYLLRKATTFVCILSGWTGVFLAGDRWGMHGRFLFGRADPSQSQGLWRFRDGSTLLLVHIFLWGYLDCIAQAPKRLVKDVCRLLILGFFFVVWICQNVETMVGFPAAMLCLCRTPYKAVKIGLPTAALSCYVTRCYIDM